MNNVAHTIVLASASPRRRELLELMGLHFAVEPSDVDESPPMDEAPGPYAVRLALEKATKVARARKYEIVIGADTVVAKDSTILGKPTDATEAQSMLRSLSGGVHEVWTGIAVVCMAKRFEAVKAVCSEVTFREVSDGEMDEYIATGEPMDKAGAYAIQGGAGRFVSRIKGSYHNVIGLPTLELARLLEQLGIEVGYVSDTV